MDSRPLLKDVKKIGVYLDSKTFNDLLDHSDRLAFAIPKHYDSDYLVFVRSPLETTHSELKNIVEYEIVLDDDSQIRAIKIVRENSEEINAFGYRMEDIQSIAERIYSKNEIDEAKLDKIISVFIQAVFNRLEKSNMYITNDKTLLKNRVWFESHFPGYPLNIMSIEEASIFLDLFFKKNGKYYTSSRYTLNKGYWYLLSTRLKIPHYNVGDLMIDALFYRLYYALMALDEMGIQYYLGVNNDTMDNTLYHFNYLISLITGIFDNLALKTNAQLEINFSDLRKVSLSKRSGREFLRKVREKNPQIRDHINSYVEFINLIYCFRELVVHREGISKTGFEYRGEEGKWKANFIRISEQMKRYLGGCGDEESEFDPFSKWGFYQLHSELFLEPYHFSTSAIKKLIEFVDKYLELLGYSSFIEDAKQRDNDFAHTLKLFEKDHLGF